MAYGLQSFNDPATREDLLDIIQDVSPDDNPLGSMLKTTTAKQTNHQWLEDYIARPTSNSGSVEGADATFSDLTQPVRRTNITQIITETFRVSGTSRALTEAGMGDTFEYQKAKAMRTWKNRQEFALLRAGLSSGASGAAPTMIGIEAVITSHYTAHLSGMSLSETVFNDMVYDVANDVSNDNVFDYVLTTLRLRQKISTFTAGNTKYVNAKDMKLVRPVMVYQSDFGVHRILGHKDVYSSNATPGPKVIGFNESKWRVAYLRKPAYEPLAKTGDSDKGQIVGELTVEFLAERSNALRTGFNQNG
jgi:hypothetical protein